ncbi:unnamed protein product [Caenorhabditis bovis]|uniref:Uncharacterized protein n=1 Tax=Caenorhabditis bovis TaxID=2654633 RepID=A0A8S1FGI1_9PELO|nr:unnamed protein product [Caenorhabditis bovis]
MDMRIIQQCHMMALLLITFTNIKNMLFSSLVVFLDVPTEKQYTFGVVLSAVFWLITFYIINRMRRLRHH